MITILGSATKYCDGISRRSFLKIGAFSFGAYQFSQADLLRAENRANPASASKLTNNPGSSNHKAVINIFLGGGPPHQDMWDIKSDAPAEIRGEFKPIATKVPGIQIGEVFPQIAARMDKCSVIRSIVGASGGHDGIQCLTGRSPNAFRAVGGWPSLGAILSKLKGSVDPSVPPFVGLAARTGHPPWSDPGSPGFLGSVYAAFKPDGQGMSNMKLSTINRAQLVDRKNLLKRFDQLKKEVDYNHNLEGLDAATERALGVLTSSKLMDALDVSKEPERIRQRYGDGKPYQYQYDGAPTASEHILIARRLVEAGARCVTLSFGRWDSHGKNFDLVRDHGSKLDQAVSALIDDLEIRGMLDDVTVVVWGEFGRTPRINKDAGRDHWPQVSCALLAGGGMKNGQVIGSTNRLGEHAASRPVTFGEVFSTIWHNLGIDPETTTIPDPSGRPTHIGDAPVIRELVA